MKDQLQEASTILWDQLLADRQFYALSFEKIEDSNNNKSLFACPELAWIIQLYREGSKVTSGFHTYSGQRYSTMNFSDRQVCTDFEEVVHVLTEEVKNMVGRPCGE